MKSLRVITLASALIAHLSFATTSITDQANVSADISSDTYIELSNIEIIDKLSLVGARHIPKNSKTNFTPPAPFKPALSLTESTKKVGSLMSTNPEDANTSPNQLCDCIQLE